MDPPTKEQSIIYQVALYSNLVAFQTGPDLEADLYAAIQKALKDNAPQIGNWSVAWGPVVVQLDTTSLAINSMYVAKSGDQPNTYVVGIAGTNPASLFDWLIEDALVAVQIPWIYALRSARGARIALGTGIGLAILQNAKPSATGVPGVGTTLLEFLRGIEDKRGMNLIVSGHSLGGALSPTLTLWLHDVRILWDLLKQVTLSTMPTAGPTAGNGAFARYSDSAITATRFANAIDVVPHAWQASDLAEIPTLYVPDIEPNETVYKLVGIAEELAKNGDYTQIVGDTGWFPGEVNKEIIYPVLGTVANFVIQLAWQHTTAYNEYFGVRSPQADAWAMQFQAAAAVTAPEVALGLAAEAAMVKTVPVDGKPTVLPAPSDPAMDELAARVLEQLKRNATPEQQQELDSRPGPGNS